MDAKLPPVRSRGLLLAVLLVVVGLSGGTLLGAPANEQATHPPSDQLVSPGDGDGFVWPYTSRSRATDGRTLALNVVVHGDDDRVRRAFVDRSDANWTDVGENETIEVSPWRPAHGSVRYSYLSPDHNGSGRWQAPAYQLAVGAYFGERTHIRAYPSRSGDWTAMQAHSEYWDWFRLRHTVTGVGPAAGFVEQDVADEPFVGDVSTAHHGLLGGGSDGSWIVVEFGPTVLIAAAVLPLSGRRLPIRDLALPGALLAVVLGVRAWGLAAEAVFPGVTPKLFVAVGYPVLVVGPIALAARLARGRPALLSALLAFAGLTVATVLDLGGVGVAQVPSHIVFHRLSLAATLGAVAYGAGREDRRLVAVGIVAWLAVLAAPLFGVV